MRFPPLASVVVILAVTVAATFAFLSRDMPVHYPYAILEAPGNLQLTFVRVGFKSSADCETALDTIIGMAQATCTTCGVKARQCLVTLAPDQRKLFSQEPLDLPSLRLPDGVLTFSSPNVQHALAICLESARQTAIKGAGALLCHPAGTLRPLTPSSPIVAPGRESFDQRVWVALAVLMAASFTYLHLRSRGGGLITGLLAWPRRRKQQAMIIADVLSIEAALWLALALRLDTLDVLQGDAFLLFLFAPLLSVPIFVGFGLYRSIVRYLGIQALFAIGNAVLLYVAVLAFVVYLLGFEGVPRTALAIHAVLAMLLIGSGRAVARIWLRKASVSSRDGVLRKNVAIYGAGSAGIQLATALSHSVELRPVAYLDDDPRLHRTRLGELEVFPPQSLQALVDRLRVKEVLLALPSASRQRRSEIIDLLESLSIQVRTLPGLSDLAEGKVKTEDLREVEIEDLLGRDPIQPDARLLKATVTGKSVMVTGAGGSIGAELCRQIVELQPECLVLFEHSEFALYSIEQELLGRGGPRIIPLLGSVTDQTRLERAISTFNVKTIFHAAAYKHVPMVEHNPCEGVFNNIFGTFRASQAAINQGVETFILISTDKAVRPTNTMGATKRFAEMILQASARTVRADVVGPRFSIVRFGNVLGSSGSVVPLFREQIRRGGPVTVTDPRIIRYFMTIAEATQLVIQAGAMGTGGDVFVLDMGAPVKILDLAQRMIRLSGLHERNAERPLGDIEIVFTGLRPGEKLFEELLIGGSVNATLHPRIMRADEKTLSQDSINGYLARFAKLLETGDSGAIRALLLDAVEEFQPECGNADLLSARARS